MDYLIQELTEAGLEVGFDRAKIIPGQRIWPQIAENISSPAKSDAWAIAVSRASLLSEPCQEELAYALDRALRARDVSFPIIGIFFEPIEPQLVPPAIRTRLYTSVATPDWVQRVKAGVAGQAPPVARDTLAPFIINKHNHNGRIVIEVRPRTGKWRPTVAAVPALERAKLGAIVVGSPGYVPTTPASFMAREGPRLAVVMTDAPTDPYDSAYIFLKALPTELTFGSPSEGYTLPISSLESLSSTNSAAPHWYRPSQ